VRCQVVRRRRQRRQDRHRLTEVHAMKYSSVSAACCWPRYFVKVRRDVGYDEATRSAFFCPSGEMLVLVVQQLTWRGRRRVSALCATDSRGQEGKARKMKTKIIALVA